jgi:hypothetical protein
MKVTLAELKRAVETAIQKYGEETGVYVDCYECIRIDKGEDATNYIDLNMFHRSPIV